MCPQRLIASVSETSLVTRLSMRQAASEGKKDSSPFSQYAPRAAIIAFFVGNLQLVSGLSESFDIRMVPHLETELAWSHLAIQNA